MLLLRSFRRPCTSPLCHRSVRFAARCTAAAVFSVLSFPSACGQCEVFFRLCTLRALLLKCLALHFKMSLRHVKKRCSVVHCDSVDRTIGVTLHRFPLDFHRCRAWAQFCRNVSLEKAPSQLRELRICSRHFEPSVYLPSGRLRHDALPTRASIADTSSECSSDMDCSQSLSETSASVRRAGEPAAVSGEPVSKGYVQSLPSQSLLLFQEDADGASPTGSTLNQACSHASGFIMVQSDHTYAGPSTEASASSLAPGTAGVAATLSASADLSPGAPFSSSPLSYEGSFTSPINERRPLQKLRAKLRQLRNRNKSLQRLLLQRRRMKTTAELVDSLREHLTPAVAAFVEAQLKMHNVSRFGRRWCSQNKTFALGLYFHSPKGYRYCRKLLQLPSVRSLQLWLARVPLRVGFYPEVFDLIEKRAASFPRQDRACTIIFDEMHVSKELSYNPVSDRFEGLEEYSAAQGPNLANKALVFMAKGICTPWKQPLGYFIADKAAPATVLHDLLFK
ncbi:uncharacterized protein [Dermacentor andersoni]|uniref:uncharacterized protein n=1 Tax=Dermacentor andersoni TaxID=34620 RepID=UPI003B3AD39A